MSAAVAAVAVADHLAGEANSLAWLAVTVSEIHRSVADKPMYLHTRAVAAAEAELGEETVSRIREWAEEHRAWAEQYGGPLAALDELDPDPYPLPTMEQLAICAIAEDAAIRGGCPLAQTLWVGVCAVAQWRQRLTGPEPDVDRLLGADPLAAAAYRELGEGVDGVLADNVAELFDEFAERAESLAARAEEAAAR